MRLTISSLKDLDHLEAVLEAGDVAELHVALDASSETIYWRDQVIERVKPRGLILEKIDMHTYSLTTGASRGPSEDLEHFEHQFRGWNDE